MVMWRCVRVRMRMCVYMFWKFGIPEDIHRTMGAVTIRDGIGIDFSQCRALCAFKIHIPNLSSNLKTYFAYIWLFSHYKCSLKSLSSCTFENNRHPCNQTTSHFRIFWPIVYLSTLMEIKFHNPCQGFVIWGCSLFWIIYRENQNNREQLLFTQALIMQLFFSPSSSYSIIYCFITNSW